MDNLLPLAVDKEITPVYLWRRGRQMFLSKTKKTLVDHYAVTRSFSECRRKLKEELRHDYSESVLRHWLEYPDVKEYLLEKWEDTGYFNSWTKEHWFGVMSRHLEGKERLKPGDLYAMKLIGTMKGWDQQGNIQFNQAINFVQSSGKE